MNTTNLTSIALRVCNMDAMVAFYSAAFDIKFKDVDTFGLPSKFGEFKGITLKFVPIRDEDEVDFENYPIHQLGFSISDVEKVINIALKHGGKLEGDITRKDGKVNAAVRDPDGNTIELYSE
ncbi:MAG: VOC family protein [Anaerolineales bacterium]|nr:VOC family protein [Anaerolineales bacterium]